MRRPADVALRDSSNNNGGFSSGNNNNNNNDAATTAAPGSAGWLQADWLHQNDDEKPSPCAVLSGCPNCASLALQRASAAACASQDEELRLRYINNTPTRDFCGSPFLLGHFVEQFFVGILS